MVKIRLNFEEIVKIPRTITIQMSKEEYVAYNNGESEIDYMLKNSNSVDQFTNRYKSNKRNGIKNGFTIIDKSKLNKDLKLRECKSLELYCDEEIK